MTLDPAMMQEPMQRTDEHAAHRQALLRQLLELQQKK
jgi:hypothetical protein